MITNKFLRDLMDSKTFKPFRVHMDDGSSYDVLNHDSAFVEAFTFDIGLNPDAEGFVQRLMRCSIRHIARIEDIQVEQPK